MALRQMNLFQSVFSKIIHGKEEMTVETLERLSTKELQALSLLLGIPKSGTKEVLIRRVVSAYGIRLKLSSYELPKCSDFIEGEDGKLVNPGFLVVKKLADDFKGKELAEMCRTMKLFRGSSKVMMAGTLLTWRERCRLEGQKFWREATANKRVESDAQTPGAAHP